jgi:hypothetical protein
MGTGSSRNWVWSDSQAVGEQESKMLRPRRSIVAAASDSVSVLLLVVAELEEEEGEGQVR